MIIVYTTCKDEAEAEAIACAMVKKRLAVCANYFPIKSVYGWKGKIQHDSEFALLLKTDKKNFEKIKKEIKKMHSYELPCILKINAEASKEFGSWVKKSLKLLP